MSTLTVLAPIAAKDYGLFFRRWAEIEFHAYRACSLAVESLRVSVGNLGMPEEEDVIRPAIVALTRCLTWRYELARRERYAKLIIWQERRSGR
ncbi:hypothetical protein CcaverHIS002_0303600 [Cutaneotrichosporon cavernicola]|nr:hypothetical protein CcaverHIS002_0303600 [Cutaneotrichosporon cavernicola]